MADNPLAALIEAGAEVRLLQDFWAFCDAVVGSRLRLSVTRKRNAEPRKG